MSGGPQGDTHRLSRAVTCCAPREGEGTGGSRQGSHGGPRGGGQTFTKESQTLRLALTFKGEEVGGTFTVEVTVVLTPAGWVGKEQEKQQSTCKGPVLKGSSHLGTERRLPEMARAGTRGGRFWTESFELQATKENPSQVGLSSKRSR